MSAVSLEIAPLHPLGYARQCPEIAHARVLRGQLYTANGNTRVAALLSCYIRVGLKPSADTSLAGRTCVLGSAAAFCPLAF
jgi:hypothetical protein